MVLGSSCRAAVSLAALVVAAAALSFATAEAHGPGQRMAAAPIVKACGKIHARGRVLRVDITEAWGLGSGGARALRRCGTARGVIHRFLRHAQLEYRGPNSSTVRYRGRRFSCYTSRPDGEGWDFHCNWASSDVSRFVDYGAGRRFKRR